MASSFASMNAFAVVEARPVFGTAPKASALGFQSRAANDRISSRTSSGSAGLTLATVGTALAAVKGRSALRRLRRKQRSQIQTTLTAVKNNVDGKIPAGGYCEAVEKCTRRKTRTVTIGSVKIGSEHPVATQTMANTLTHDVEATVEQIKRCADKGIDIVRVTVQGMREAKACEHIKRRLLEDGYTTPIVADIHFTPKVAMVVADHVDKVRVNPGNFADGRKSFDTIKELSEADVREALDSIEEAFVPLVLKLKEQNKALRIGVNHGSMAERILFQYGDTPEGMVASAIEFGEICRKHDFHNFVFSMKSSNPQVMVQAYRLLAREMYRLGWDYPLHLGVTEAGGGSDGRIKSAVGIGALLLDGLGDTVRVSLTEDPEQEVKPCAALRRAGERALGRGVSSPFGDYPGRRDGIFAPRKCDFPLDVPLNSDGSVITVAKADDLLDLKSQRVRRQLGLHLRDDGDLQKDWKTVDAVVVEGEISEQVREKLKELLNIPVGVLCRPGPNVPEGATLLYDANEVREPLVRAGKRVTEMERLGGRALVFNGDESREELVTALRFASPRFLLLRPKSQDGVTFLCRRFFALLESLEEGRLLPTMLWFRYQGQPGDDEDDAVIRASAEFGSIFVDGMGEGLLWESSSLSAADLRESSFNLLQASRKRITKTEFISCPSCGRTLFDLQETTKRIQQRTGHLPGVRIAVMGCIVNGPGEMADADFGYVGSGVGKVDLYVGYECVRRGIPSGGAVDALTQLIREHGRWQDPPEVSSDVETADSNPDGSGSSHWAEAVDILGLQLIQDTL
eukprot:TRINITY_DN16850_c0_g1_i1.p1 TRINITY_DN16850_c0_g1~~TRINITY_DN16850_c0_g1_i1.p1  ORF type:complete len:797 (+),score=133.69 TRINITY_DN16850_c0_g1_i1:96-2486(+)